MELWSFANILFSFLAKLAIISQNFNLSQTFFGYTGIYNLSNYSLLQTFVFIFGKTCYNFTKFLLYYYLSIWLSIFYQVLAFPNTLLLFSGQTRISHIFPFSKCFVTDWIE